MENFIFTPLFMYSYMLLAKLHMVLGLLTGVGIVFLIIWAAKTLPVKKLKKFGVWFVIIGIVGAVLLGGGGYKGKFGGMHGFGGKGCSAMQKSGTTYNQAMMEAMSARGMEMTEEEMDEMMKEVKGGMMK